MTGRVHFISTRCHTTWAGAGERHLIGDCGSAGGPNKTIMVLVFNYKRSAPPSDVDWSHISNTRKRSDTVEAVGQAPSHQRL